MHKIKLLDKWIKEAHNIVFLAGAGMSCPSGIPDFRSQNGIYNLKLKRNLNPELILSHDFFYNYPEIFYEFYFKYLVYKDAKPNISHYYCHKLEKIKNFTLITQNIDYLDKKANINNVIMLHGNIYDNYCTKCLKYYNLDDLNLNEVPYCTCNNIIKPDVVLYNENLKVDDINNSIKAIEKADLLVILGTSLNVYPAASFINYYNKDHLVIINKDISKFDNLATLVIEDDIEHVFNELDKLL